MKKIKYPATPLGSSHCFRRLEAFNNFLRTIIYTATFLNKLFALSLQAAIQNIFPRYTGTYVVHLEKYFYVFKKIVFPIARRFLPLYFSAETIKDIIYFRYNWI